MDAEPDYYEILEVHPKASPEVITRAYRTLVARYHPDAHPPEEKARAEERMKLLNQAYQVLSNPARRAEYDRRRTSGLSLDAETVTSRWRQPEPGARAPRAAPRRNDYCAHHPGAPRAAFCHECGKPICAACVRFLRGQPVCAQCVPRLLKRELSTRMARVASLAQEVSWPLAVAAGIACLAAATGGSALLFPVLLTVSPGSPVVTFLVVVALGFWAGAALILWLVGVFERRRWVWPGTCLLVVVSLGGSGVGLRWWLADHASRGCKALWAGEHRKAFYELSVAEAARGALRDPSVRRCYALSALRLADEECRRGSSRRLPLSRIAVQFAEDIMAFVQQPDNTGPQPGGENLQGIGRPPGLVAAPETKMQLVEAFSRALFHQDILTRKKEWERAMRLLGVPPPEARPGQGEPQPAQAVYQSCAGAEASASGSPKSTDTAQKYAEAVCYCEMAEVLSAWLPRLARTAVKLAKAAGVYGSAFENDGPILQLPEPTVRIASRAGGPDPGPCRECATKAMSDLLKDIPAERWRRCSPNVQRMVDEVRSSQIVPG